MIKVTEEQLKDLRIELDDKLFMYHKAYNEGPDIIHFIFRKDVGFDGFGG